MKILRSLSSFAGLILPASCLVCGRSLRQGFLCRHCRIAEAPYPELRCPVCDLPSLEPIDDACETCRCFPPLFRRSRAAFEYHGAVRALITAMKYRPSERLCRYAGELLGAYARHARWPFDWDLIVPVPSSPAHLRQRGFNQALILAEEVQHALKPVRRIPIEVAGLHYTGRHKAQAGLRPEERARNVRRMFDATDRFRGKKVLLIDDVLTTGATSSAAGLALKRAGVRQMDLLVAARSPSFRAMGAPHKAAVAASRAVIGST